MGRPSEPIIDVPRVVEEALAMIDEGGLKSLSMRGLGRRLGINPASLYHHFHNKDDLLEAVRAQIFRKIKFPARMGSKRWDEQLVILGKTFRAGMMSHPNAMNLVAATNPARTRMMGHPLYEGVVKALLEAGFDEGQSVFLLTGIEIISGGSAAQEASLGNALNYGAVDIERFPNLHRVSQNKSLSISRIFVSLLEDFVKGASARMLEENRIKQSEARREKSASKRYLAEAQTPR